jgi:hypothetical protein
MGRIRRAGLGAALLLLVMTAAGIGFAAGPAGAIPAAGPSSGAAPSWQSLATPFKAGQMLLLHDGSVIAQVWSGFYGTTAWAKLTPSAKGSYLNGTWSQIASMPSSYAPTSYASAVLPDGRVIIMGGEAVNGVRGSNELAPSTTRRRISGPRSLTPVGMTSSTPRAPSWPHRQWTEFAGGRREPHPIEARIGSYCVVGDRSAPCAMRDHVVALGGMAPLLSKVFAVPGSPPFVLDPSI